jgi:hypothetical protein
LHSSIPPLGFDNPHKDLFEANPFGQFSLLPEVPLGADREESPRIADCPSMNFSSLFWSARSILNFQWKFPSRFVFKRTRGH